MPEAYIGKKDLLDNQATMRLDIGRIEHDVMNRPRPYPYDLTAPITLTLNDGGAVDVFGVYTQLIPQGTYNFGDSPNYVQIVAINVEDISANATYILEFYRYDGVTYTPIGAIRFAMVGPFTRSFQILWPCRPFNNDTLALYGRLKSSVATGQHVDFSLTVARFIRTDYHIALSTGPWPFG